MERKVLAVLNRTCKSKVVNLAFVVTKDCFPGSVYCIYNLHAFCSIFNNLNRGGFSWGQ